jgi:hypothetical protein
MPSPLYPSLYQINTRLTLTGLARSLGRATTLDDLPEALLDRVAELGFDWLWPLGVWQTSAQSRRVAQTTPNWGRAAFQRVVPDLTDADVCGSPFAVESYTVHTNFGGDAALTRLRERLSRRGLKLLLDFVPNHVGLGHPWTKTNPSFFIHGSEADLKDQPQNYTRLEDGAILAYGRDPYFDGWSDTLQLNYRDAGLRQARIQELLGVAQRCDGVRCDMAMLLLPEVFQRTWGERSRPFDGSAPVDEPFWPAAVAAVKRQSPGFIFMAEVYWDLEWTLQQHGFDYTYDKRLYDRLRGDDVEAVRGHLLADPEFQRRSVRFLENHDEPRVASIFPFDRHRAAAVATFFVPGLRFFHQGQFEGRRWHLPMQVSRGPAETNDAEVSAFYMRLLECLKRPEVRAGTWRLLHCAQAWTGNPTSQRFLAYGWQGGDGGRTLAVVNYGPTQGQCYVRLETLELRGKRWLLSDLLSPARYERRGDELDEHGLYLDLPSWGRHVFAVAEIGT